MADCYDNPFFEEDPFFEDVLDATTFFMGPSNINSPLAEDTDVEYAECDLPDTSYDDNTYLTEKENFEVLNSHLGRRSTSSVNSMTFHDRLKTTMPYDDGKIAFGTIRLYEGTQPGARESQTYIRGSTSDDTYPNLLVKNAMNKGWIRTDGLSIGTRLGTSFVRVYVLPEDVDRSARGNLKDFRKFIRYLIPYIDCTVSAWTGTEDPYGSVLPYHEPCLDVEESLFYTFNTLPSPSIVTSYQNDSSYGSQAIADVVAGEIMGLKTDLYPYQKRSVAAMIKKEAAPAMIKDPRKHKMLDMYGNVFYLDINSGTLTRSLQCYSEPQGGILAETMGFGKTLICLALVLATRGHYPKIPQDRIETRELGVRPTTGSLLSMAARKLKQEGLPWKNEFYSLTKAGYHYDRCVAELQKYERAYDEPIPGTFNPRRKAKPEYQNTVRLCSATLVILPPNLVLQWREQIRIHVYQEALDVLVIEGTNDKVPPWEELVKYDVVLMSKSRFEQEYRDDDLNQGRGIRYADKYKSSLTEVRWLRVICDEGHGFAGSASKTNAIAMLDKMFIERRWVVSGTPSSTLHGVEVGLASVESDTWGTPSGRRQSFNSALKQKRIPQAQDHEAKDLERLRLIVVNFLKLQPWANKKGEDQADWKSYLAPRTNSAGHKYSMPALREVMQTLIIRHQIQDIEMELTLPALHNRVVYLEPSYYDRLSINIFTMVLTSNYVTSEREDEDYMFHPKNRGNLTILTNNLRLATFYWVGFTRQNVEDTLKVSNKYLDAHVDTISDADGVILTKAIMTGERAMFDPSWQAFSLMHEMGVYVSNMPAGIGSVWALDAVEQDPVLMGTTQARELQKSVKAQVDTDTNGQESELRRVGIKVMDAARKRTIVEEKAREKSENTSTRKMIGVSEEPQKRATFTSANSPSKVDLRRNQHAKPPRTSQNEPPARKGSSGEDSVCTVEGAQVVGFASSKLAYLCDQILFKHPEEKSIIFYTRNDTAWYVAEALELLGVSFRIYANTLTVAQRAQYLIAFNNDPEIRVLLMDLKQAGQGLHVAAASRVYIISPIWDPAIESQAIKRAHRIGQHREVFVETLVLKDTFEELLVKRIKSRTEQQDHDEQAHEDGKSVSVGTAQAQGNSEKTGTSPANTMLDDSVMIKVLKEISFLDIEDSGRKFAPLKQPVPLVQSDAPISTLVTTALIPRSIVSSGSAEGKLIAPSLPALQAADTEPSGFSSIFGPKEPTTPATKRLASNDVSSSSDTLDFGHVAEGHRAESHRSSSRKRVKFEIP